MADYTQDINDAYDDILAAGVLATIIRPISSYSVVDETEVLTAIIGGTVAAVSFPASQGTVQAFDNRFIEDYKKGKIRFFYVAAKGLIFEPEAGDLFYFDSQIWEVSGVTPLNPDGLQPVIYTMGVKPSNLDTLPGGIVIDDPIIESNYTDDINDAYKDILEAGILATVSRIVSIYDEVADTETVISVTTSPVAVVSFPASQGAVQAFDNRFIEDYKKGKIRFFYMAGKGLTFEPAAGDLLYFDSKVWEIAGATPLNPNSSQSIIYIIGAKQSGLLELPVEAIVYIQLVNGNVNILINDNGSPLVA